MNFWFASSSGANCSPSVQEPVTGPSLRSAAVSYEYRLRAAQLSYEPALI